MGPKSGPNAQPNFVVAQAFRYSNVYFQDEMQTPNIYRSAAGNLF